MLQRNYELYLALATALLVILWYLFIVQQGVPRSSGLIGYSLGIGGFVMMLGAETLYTWRKQKRGARWGRMQLWLQAHIYLGLVGPFLVLLHSAWRLNGVAGATMGLTMLIVASGFLCSYIYTAVPRTVDGAEVTRRELEAQIAALNTQIEQWTADRPATITALAERLSALTGPTQAGGAGTVLGRALLRWRYQYLLRRELRQLDATGKMQARQLTQLLNRRYRLDLQARSLVTARNLLGYSRTIHILLGVVLFALAFVHIGAALYYATFAH